MLYAIFALALLGVAQAQEWRVTAYDGLRCNGRALEDYEPSENDPEAPACIGPLIPNAASVVFEVFDSATSAWILELHEEISCRIEDGLPGSGATLSPGDNPYCLTANDASYVYIASQPSRSLVVQNDTAVETTTATKALIDRGEMGLAKRVDGVEFAIASIVGAVTVAEALRNRCVSFGASDQTGDNILCALYIAASIVAGALVATRIAGVTQHAAAPARLGKVESEMLSLLDSSIDSFSSTELFEGMTTILTKMPAEHIVARNLAADDDTWLHLHMQVVDETTGSMFDCDMDIDTVSNKTLLATNGLPLDNNGKRQASQATGYYSYDNLDEDLMSSIPSSTQLAWELGNDLWDYMEAEDASQVCANIEVSGADGLLHAANRGFVSIITGQFFDQLEECPY